MFEGLRGMLALPEDPNERAAAKQGLLAAGAAMMSSRGQNFLGAAGEGLGAGAQGYQGGLAQQQQQQYRQAQTQQIEMENQQRQAAIARPGQVAASIARARARQGGAGGTAAPTILSRDQLPRVGDPRTPATQPPQAPPQQMGQQQSTQSNDDPFDFHYANAKQLAMDGLHEEAKQEYEMAKSFRPEVRDVSEMMVGGQRVMVQTFKDGRPPQVLDGFAPQAKPLVFADNGGTYNGRDAYTGEVKSTSQNSVAPNTAAQIAQQERSSLRSNATTIRGQDMVDARAERSSPSNKPLPAAALKMQQAELDALSTARGINADLSRIEGQLQGGKLSFGPVSNLVNRGRNAAGMSTEESRNFASFQSTLEKLRNDSLRLNAGVQTDGDAQRAWNELFANINDSGVVQQRLTEIRNINGRAAQLRKLNVDGIRANYGHEPLDTTQYEQAGQPAAREAPAAVKSVKELPKKAAPTQAYADAEKERRYQEFKRSQGK